jgi:hypothetical protein
MGEAFIVRRGGGGIDAFFDNRAQSDLMSLVDSSLPLDQPGDSITQWRLAIDDDFLYFAASG